MKPSSIPRRQFLATGLTRLAGLTSALALPLLPLRTLEQCTRGVARPGPHPTPRPGIDASRVPAASALGDDSGVRTAFDQVRQIPGIADGIRCHCGCAELPGFYSLLSCFEGDGMGKWCPVCKGAGRLTVRLRREGKTLDEIRTAVDAQFG